MRRARARIGGNQPRKRRSHERATAHARRAEQSSGERRTEAQRGGEGASARTFQNGRFKLREFFWMWPPNSNRKPACPARSASPVHTRGMHERRATSTGPLNVVRGASRCVHRGSIDGLVRVNKPQRWDACPSTPACVHAHAAPLSCPRRCAFGWSLYINLLHGGKGKARRNSMHAYEVLLNIKVARNRTAAGEQNDRAHCAWPIRVLPWLQCAC